MSSANALNFKKFKEDNIENTNLSNDVTLDSEKFHAELRKMESNCNV